MYFYSSNSLLYDNEVLKKLGEHVSIHSLYFSTLVTDVSDLFLETTFENACFEYLFTSERHADDRWAFFGSALSSRTVSQRSIRLEYSGRMNLFQLPAEKYPIDPIIFFL